MNGDTVDSVKSLHGLPEAKEDLRQLCVMKSYPDKFWDYLNLINAQCYPIYKNATQLATCQANVTTTLGIDNQKIETCATGSEGIALLRADEAITKNLKITGSPTLMMNGQKYAGQRTAEAYKQAICARFETPPAECGVNLSARRQQLLREAADNPVFLFFRNLDDKEMFDPAIRFRIKNTEINSKF